MARAKAKFNRPPDLVDLPEPSAPDPGIYALRRRLRSLHPAQADDSLTDEVFGDPASAFVEALLNEAHWAWSFKNWNDESLRKDEIDAECRALSTKLQAALHELEKYPGKTRSGKRLPELAKMLRHVSRDVDLLLGLDTDVRDCADVIDQAVQGHLQPSVCADAISKLLVVVRDALQCVSEAPRRRRPTPFIAKELALRVIRVFEEEGLSTATTAKGTGLAKASSPLVSCLKALGDRVGLALSEKTWSEHAITAVRNGARLRSKDGPALKASKNSRQDDSAAPDVIDVVLGWGLRK